MPSTFNKMNKVTAEPEAEPDAKPVPKELPALSPDAAPDAQLPKELPALSMGGGLHVNRGWSFFESIVVECPCCGQATYRVTQNPMCANSG